MLELAFKFRKQFLYTIAEIVSESIVFRDIDK